MHPANGGLANSSHLGGGLESETAYGVAGGDALAGAGSGLGGVRRGGGVRAAISKLFSRGHDMEAAGVNHAYTGEERTRLKQFQSIDYLAPSSRVYRAWLAAQPYARYWDRWLMMALIGMAVGLVGFSLHTLVHILASAKYHGTRCDAPHAQRAPPHCRAAPRCPAAALRRRPCLVGLRQPRMQPCTAARPQCSAAGRLKLASPVGAPVQLAAVAHARGGGLDVQHLLFPGLGLCLHVASGQCGP